MQSPTPSEETEALYKKYHSSTACRSDWYVTAAVLFLIVVLVIEIPGHHDRIVTGTAYAVTGVLGFCPIHFAARRKKAFYIAWREWFILNSILWAMVRFRFCLGSVVPGEYSPEVSDVRFALRALLRGPHVVILLCGAGYSLRAQTAFPFACIMGVLASWISAGVHSKMLAAAAARPHLDSLARYMCSGYYGEFVLTLTGVPCTANNILLNLWGAQCGLAVFVLFFSTVLRESIRRKRFFAISGRREPFPVFWDDFWFSSCLTFVMAAGILALQFVCYKYLEI